MPNLRCLLKYVPATSSAFFSHQNISKNTYFQITKKKGSEISLHVHFKDSRFLNSLNYIFGLQARYLIYICMHMVARCSSTVLKDLLPTQAGWSIGINIE